MLRVSSTDIKFAQSAKMLRYLGFSTTCDAAFVVFMISWLVTRNFLFGLVIIATWKAWYIIPRVWDPARGHFMTREIYIGFFTMLCVLQVRDCATFITLHHKLKDLSPQVLQLVWFGMICRVAYRVVTGSGAEDTRSDDEE